MSYKDKEQARMRSAERMAKMRAKEKGVTSNVTPTPKGVTSVYKGVTLSRPVDLSQAPDPDDALDPRNYSEAYLGAMAKQGTTLTEASRIAMATIGWMKGVDPVRLWVFQSRYHLSSDREFKGRKKVAKV